MARIRKAIGGKDDPLGEGTIGKLVIPPKVSLSDAEQPMESKRPDTNIKKTIGKLEKTIGNTDVKTIGKDGEPILNPDTIYFFDLKRVDSQLVYVWKRFHGKCADAGLTPLKTIGSLAIQSGFVLATDKDRSRTTCEHCGKQANSVLAKQLETEQLAKRSKRKNDWERETRKQLEREKEMVLLGQL